MLDKYGVENSMHLDETKEKIALTNLERYGAENVFASEYGKRKIKETMLDKYGVANPMESDVFKQKIKDTKLERYGSENYQNMEKIIETNLKNYGVLYPQLSEEIRNKTKENNLKKYGVEHTVLLKRVRNEIFESNNGEEVFINKLRLKNLANVEDFVNLSDFVKANKMSLTDLSIYFNISRQGILKVLKERDLLSYIIDDRKFSIQEEIIMNKLRAKEIKFDTHNRTLISPYEIDLFFNNIGLKVNPISTHYDKENVEEALFIFPGVSSSYHLDKVKRCLENKVNLISLFDWISIDDVLDLLEGDVFNNLVKEGLITFEKDYLILDNNFFLISFLEDKYKFEKFIEPETLHYNTKTKSLDEIGIPITPCGYSIWKPL